MARLGAAGRRRGRLEPRIVEKRTRRPSSEFSHARHAACRDSSPCGVGGVYFCALSASSGQMAVFDFVRCAPHIQSSAPDT